MGGRDILKNKLKELFLSKNKSGRNEPSKKLSYLIIIALVGLLLLIVGNLFTTTKDSSNNEQISVQPDVEVKKNVTEEQTTTSDVSELEASYQKDLEAMLEKIQGVSEVEVMVNLDSTDVQVYEKNLITSKQTTDENDKNGGTRQIEENSQETQVVLIRQGDREMPLHVQTKKPAVRGVFVVAKGVDHASIKKWVVEATARVLDVPTHRVSVMPKN